MSVSGARAAPTLRLIESQCERGINKVQYGLVRDLVSWRLAAHKLVHKVDNAAGVACLQSAQCTLVTNATYHPIKQTM